MATRPPTYRPPGYKPRQQAERERKAKLDQQRGTPAERGYDTDWYAFRARFLRANPVCCCGCGGRAEVIDHIRTIRERPDLRLEPSNCRPMTKRCHDRRTARDQGFAKRSHGAAHT